MLVEQSLNDPPLQLLAQFYFKNKAWERNWQVFPLTSQQDGV